VIIRIQTKCYDSEQHLPPTQVSVSGLHIMQNILTQALQPIVKACPLCLGQAFLLILLACIL